MMCEKCGFICGSVPITKGGKRVGTNRFCQNKDCDFEKDK